MSGEPNLSKVSGATKSRRAAICGLAACAGATLTIAASFANSAENREIRSGTSRNTQNPARAESPFACSLEQSLTKEQRAHKKQIALKMESARIETKEIADGYVFRFRPDAVSFAEIADWVATERVCCPFFDLAIEAERENGPLSLRISGREGVKNFIRGEFQTLKLK
jgi:hypothetical protein